MPGKVALAITAGPEVGRQYVFAERTTVLIGRGSECLLDVNPPEVRIRDLGSRIDTHINGQPIGKRDKFR